MKMILMLLAAIATSSIAEAVKQAQYTWSYNEKDVFDGDGENDRLRGAIRRSPASKGANKKPSYNGDDDDDDDDDEGKPPGKATPAPLPATPAPVLVIPFPVPATSAPVPAVPPPISSPVTPAPANNGNTGGPCDDPIVTKTWDNIKLAPGNAISPFTGVEFAFGIGQVSLVVDSCTGFFEACVNTTIQGFDVTTVQIGRGKMNQNGGTVVDFSSLLGSGSSFTGCRGVPESLYLELVRNPDEFYLTASPGGVGTKSIRGQLLQGFMAPLTNEQTVAPYNNIFAGASGMATVTFENGGETVCFDATVVGFDPVLAQINFGEPGANGPIFFDFSSVKLDRGRFLGCLAVADLGQTQLTICELLADGYLYYFDFHLSDTEPGVFTTIRGQLPQVN